MFAVLEHVNGLTRVCATGNKKLSVRNVSSQAECDGACNYCVFSPNPLPCFIFLSPAAKIYLLHDTELTLHCHCADGIDAPTTSDDPEIDFLVGRVAVIYIREEDEILVPSSIPPLA
jgi:hypothetical protein